MDYIPKTLQVLLVEDNEGDVRLVKEAFNESKIDKVFSVAKDGEEALNYLYRRGKYAESVRPDIILLDINLPKKNGFEVLESIKKDDDLKRIPVIMLSSSSSEDHISKSYDLSANCYVTKPVDFDEYTQTVKTIEDFWFQMAKLPGV
ncbi:MAG TPA: response regulator [Ignavibacteria bacterium]|jgi:DNA-binding response OmpR family regulator|nr:response regulator [Ignavibacteria bacterium]